MLNVIRLRSAGLIFVKKGMKTINIREIQFNSFSQKAICFGQLKTKNLAVDSSIELSFSALNRMLGIIGGLLAQGSVYDLIEEDTHDAETYYRIKLEGHEIPALDLEYFTQNGYPTLKISA